MRIRGRLSLGLLCLALTVAGCSERQLTEGGGGLVEYDLISVNSRGGGTLDINGITVLVVENPFGSVIVDGESRLGTMRWFMDNHVAALTRSRAETVLDQVAIDWRVAGNTLYATVLAPPVTDSLQTSVGVSFGVPPDRDIRVAYADGAVFSAFMQGDFTVEEAAGVELTAHSGSCELRLAEGSVTGLLALPVDAACYISTVKGNIDVQVTPETEAQVLLETSDGVTRVEGLALAITEQRPTRITGTLGGGRGILDLRTGQGNVTLRPR